MGRDVGGHANSNTAGTVEEQIGYPRREDNGLFVAAVVVLFEVDRILVDVGDELFGNRRHPHFGVAHGSGRIAIDGAEVALTVDERVAHGEGLGEPNHCVIDGNVVVGVVAAEYVSDDASALAVAGVCPGAGVEHAPDDAPLNGLEAVLDPWERARHDHTHGVVEIALAHLDFDATWANRGSRLHGHGDAPAWGNGS